MRAVTDYRERARECRELARMVHKLEDNYALNRAARSWERLAGRRGHPLLCRIYIQCFWIRGRGTVIRASREGSTLMPTRAEGGFGRQ
jgi:hypothetical protein